MLVRWRVVHHHRPQLLFFCLCRRRRWEKLKLKNVSSLSSFSLYRDTKLSSLMAANHQINSNIDNGNIINNNYDKLVSSYSQYDHTDACNESRWTSRESYEFMLDKPWQQVVDFYSNLVSSGQIISFSKPVFPTQHRKLLQETQTACDDSRTQDFSNNILCESMRVPKKKRGGRWDRVTFKIIVSYHGPSFDGWQKQPGLNTVQSSVEKTLGRFVDEMKAEQLKERGLPIEGTAVVAGRTDKGVTALQQICSFYTWRKDVKPQDIVDAFSEGEQGKLRIVSVSEVSRVFHPNFCAKWRRYLYIFPLRDEDVEQNNTNDEKINHGESNGGQNYKFAQGIDQETAEDCPDYDENVLERSKKPNNFEISKVNELLFQLEGKLLSYKMFARDTKASRNTGPPTECFMFHARAAEARIPSSVQDGEGTRVMCVELVANRFLRKMVRVLVATAVREAAAGAEKDALIKLMDATCRRATAPPAPPQGLCLVDVGYSDFDPSICYIL